MRSDGAVGMINLGSSLIFHRSERLDQAKSMLQSDSSRLESSYLEDFLDAFGPVPRHSMPVIGPVFVLRLLIDADYQSTANLLEEVVLVVSVKQNHSVQIIRRVR